jgi:benzoyl-CoA reductase/2-hydroxyglutaryl-CoA dehydratase subunit BcrC/BadD/HgdB
METVKVTKTLARKVETTAKQMRVSSEKLVSLALEDFLKRNQNKDLLQQINNAYQDLPNTEEKLELRLQKNKSVEILDEWK